MTRNVKIGLGLAVAVVLLFLLMRPSKSEDKPQWNRHETPDGKASVGVFGLDWG